MNAKIRFRTAIYIGVTLFVLTAVSLLCAFAGVTVMLNNLLDISYFDVLTGQIANTLIVLSLTSVLSDNFGQAYWMDIKECKLITPFWGCFVGITVYLLTALLFSVVSYGLDFRCGLIVSAVASTCLLVTLTFKMISIYFGKETLKKQLRMDYRKMMILDRSPYYTDYLRRLETLLKECEAEQFPKKNRFVKKIRKELKASKEKLNAGEKAVVDKAYEDHRSVYEQGMKHLEQTDTKIIEYTKNAIACNDTEVIRENIELLVETENYRTFFELLEPVFDWDANYALDMLRELSRKNAAWIIKDQMPFFMKYALQELISKSGKLDVIQKLLRMYDPSNLGMRKLAEEFREIGDAALALSQQEQRSLAELEKRYAGNQDEQQFLLECHQLRNSVKEDDERLARKLEGLLATATTKDLRSYYLPIEEICIAYEEGKYSIANRYIEVILASAEKDLRLIKFNTNMKSIKKEMEFTFSYVTQQEIAMIQRLIKRDEHLGMILAGYKVGLLKLQEIRMDNNPWSDMTPFMREVFRSTLDLPKEE